MWKKLLGVVSGFLSLSSAVFVFAALGDLIGGNSGTETGVLVGLFVFFTGLTLSTGYGAYRMLRSERSTTNTTSVPAQSAHLPGPAVDIALEARILHLAQQHDGRVTPAEIAIACSVSLDDATKALDGLLERGHADIHVADDGSQVYVLRGFLSPEEKRQAAEVLATRD